MDDVPDLTVFYRVPRGRPSARFRVRQILWAFVRVQVSEPKPAVFVVNRSGVPRLLFVVPDELDVEAKARAVAVDLESLDIDSFCDRYRLPPGFLSVKELPRRRVPELRPLL